MPNVMTALPNIGGALCSTPQSLADAQYWRHGSLLTFWRFTNQIIIIMAALCNRGGHYIFAL